ncbi:hypothetical protein N9M31_05750 [Alphaproteobacteria bacterium]|nr:hypothetical protein [Alphaproteobacteria bacterium]
MLTKDNVAIGIEWRFGPDWPGQRCGAKTRRGTACQRPANKKNGRCRLHGGASTGPKTAEGRARIAAAQFKHGNRSKAAIAAQRARAARGRAIRAELAALEAEVIREGLLKSNWRDDYRI